MSDKVKTLFVSHIISDESNKLSLESLEWLPTVICISCSKNLSQIDTKEKSDLKYVDYSSLIPPQEFRESVVTRNTKEVDCKCSVCDVARMNLFSYKQYREKMSDPPGNHLRLTSENSCGVHYSEDKEQTLICNHCLSSYRRGKSHDCNSPTRRSNLEQMVRESSDTTKKRLLSSQLKEFVDGMGIERGEQTEIATGGRPLPVTVGVK